MIAQINVAPLIDVMLVLLIVFMVITPVATRSLDTSLPGPAADGQRATAPLIVVVEPEVFRLNDIAISNASDLGARLGEMLSSRSDRTVFVRAEGAVSYGRVVEAMDHARGAGAARIGILGAKR